MDDSAHRLPCYISAFHNTRIDSFLERHGFTRSLLAFAIPDLGILFKCRADSESIDLEFAAFFALLKFIKTSLKEQQIKDILVHSSNAEFVFAFVAGSSHLVDGSPRKKLLREYVNGLNVAVTYVEPYKNKTRVPPDDCPKFPGDKQPVLKPEAADWRSQGFQPFQRGIKL
jgi:hypothetical protein